MPVIFTAAAQDAEGQDAYITTAARRLGEPVFAINQTSQVCTWHVPRAHYLESWGDARAWDGTWSIVQPLIEPLMGGCSAIELLALITDDPVTAGYDIVRRTMSESARRTDFESLWRRTLHDGFLAGSAATLQARQVGRGAGATAVQTIWQQWTPASEGTFELVFVEDMKVSDGRYANNGWLQELPDPMTKLTWDNAVLMGVDAAERLRLESGDMVRIDVGDRRELMLTLEEAWRLSELLDRMATGRTRDHEEPA